MIKSVIPILLILKNTLRETNANFRQKTITFCGEITEVGDRNLKYLKTSSFFIVLIYFLRF